MESTYCLRNRVSTDIWLWNSKHPKLEETNIPKSLSLQGDALIDGEYSHQVHHNWDYHNFCHLLSCLLIQCTGQYSLSPCGHMADWELHLWPVLGTEREEHNSPEKMKDSFQPSAYCLTDSKLKAYLLKLFIKGRERYIETTEDSESNRHSSTMWGRPVVSHSSLIKCIS